MILSVPIAQIQAQVKDIFFSQNNTNFLINNDVAFFELQHISVIQCAALCFRKTCCKEFMFNTASHQCIGLHFPDFDSNVNLITFPLYEGYVTYQKGKFQQHYFNKCFIYFFFNVKSKLILRMFSGCSLHIKKVSQIRRKLLGCK